MLCGDGCDVLSPDNNLNSLGLDEVMCQKAKAESDYLKAREQRLWIRGFAAARGGAVRHAPSDLFHPDDRDRWDWGYSSFVEREMPYAVEAMYAQSVGYEKSVAAVRQFARDGTLPNDLGEILDGTYKKDQDLTKRSSGWVLE